MRRTHVSVLIAIIAALGLIGATSSSATGVGTASTSMTALELEVHGLDLPTVTLADIATYASTDRDLAENTTGSGQPFALASILPAVVGGSPIGAIEARSDGKQSDASTALDEAIGILSAVVNPARVSASATAERAVGAAELATASLSTVGGLLGLDLSVNTSGIVSDVTQTAASATQGLDVGAIELSVGDLLPADVLAQLPLGTLIELLDLLPVDVGVDVAAVIDAVADALDALGTAVSGIAAAAAELPTASDALDAALATADAAAATLTDANAAVATATAVVQDAQAAVDELVTDLAGSDLDLATKYVVECAAALDIRTCVEGLLTAAQTALAAAQDVLAAANTAATAALGEFDAAQALVAQLTAAVEALVQTVVDLVGSLTDLLADLTDALTAFDGLDLDAILDAIAAGDLIEIGAIQIGVVATATGDPATTTATVGCNDVPVTVLGIEIATPSCAAPLDAASDLVGDITGALEGVLGVLPLVGDIVPDVRFEMFTDLVETTSIEDGYNRATAGVVALRLGVDETVLCATCVVDGLLEDVLALAGDLLGSVEAALPDTAVLTDLGLGALAAEVDAAVAALPSVDDVLAALVDLIDSLPLGALPTDVALPGFDLVVDPVSAASFTTDAAPPSGPPSSADPTLPATGGGLAMLGGMVAAGALALRRRG